MTDPERGRRELSPRTPGQIIGLVLLAIGAVLLVAVCVIISRVFG